MIESAQQVNFQAWRSVLSGRNGEKKAGCAEAVDAFFSLVQEHALQLGDLPPRARLADVSLITHCLQQSGRKQEQLECLRDIPKCPHDVEAIFQAGFGIADKHLRQGGLTQPPWEAIERGLSCKALIPTALRFLDKVPCRRNWAEYKTFFAELQSSSTLIEAQRVDLIKLALQLSCHEGQEGSLISLLEWALRIHASAGERAYLNIFSHRPRDKASSVTDVTRLCEYVSDMAEERCVLDTLQKLGAGTLSRRDARLYLDQQATEVFLRRYPEKPLKQVLDNMLVASEDVSVCLSEKNVQQLHSAYEAVESAQSRFAKMSQEAVAAELNATRKASCGRMPTLKETALILGAAADGIRRTLKIKPYNQQVLVVLGVICKDPARSGRIAQVKTGEGKSTISAMLAAYYAVLGHPVHVISSARQLAVRDFEKYTNYLRFFGISASHVCHDRQLKSHFDAHVLYGTTYDLEFAVLQDGLSAQKLFAPEFVSNTARPPVCVVDEVDSMLLDKGSHPAIISGATDDPYYELVKPIFRYVKERIATFGPSDRLYAEAGLFISHLHSSGLKKAADLASKASEKELIQWLHACHWALLSAQADRDYCIRKGGTSSAQPRDEVVIVDWQNTGEPGPGCRWQGRRHQFVEMKHGIEPQAEALTAAQITHVDFFRRYELIAGLTGTVGSESEREELLSVYNVDTFDVPTYAGDRRVVWPMTVCSDQDKQHAAMVAEIGALAPERPCLVLMPYISESRKFAKRLEQAQIAHQIFNGTGREDADVVTARAGRGFMVTVATNMAGRGTDIVLSPEAKAAGGLHVILGFYPTNDRVEAQGMGRSARQGQDGSAHFILRCDDSLLRTIEGTVSKSTLVAHRKKVVEAASRERISSAAFFAISHKAVCEYFKLLEGWYSETVGGKLESLSNLFLTGSCSTVITGLYAVQLDILQSQDRAAPVLTRACKDQDKAMASVGLQIIKEVLQTWINREWGRTFSQIAAREEELRDNLTEKDLSVTLFKREAEQAVVQFKISPAGQALTNPSAAILMLAQGLLKP